MPRRHILTENFDPALEIGDYFVMLGANGLRTAKGGGSGVYVVNGVESTGLSLNQHGVLVVWADSGVAPAGYLADANMQSSANHIASGGIYQYPLNSLAFRSGQLAQLRFRTKFFAVVTGAVDDYDIVLAAGSTLRWSFNKIAGVLNSMFQSQDPGDSIVAPAQGANITLPAAFPNAPPSHWSARTQLFLLEDLSAQVQIKNNGSVVTAGGAIGLAISGWVINFAPAEDIPGYVPQNAVGILPDIEPIALPVGVSPADITFVQVEPRAPT